MSETRSTTQAELLREVAEEMKGVLLLVADCKDALADQSRTLARLEARPALDEKTLARRISDAWAGDMLPLPTPPEAKMPWGWITVILALTLLLGMVVGQVVLVASHGQTPPASYALPKKAK